jgi:hypothetical protein
VTVLTQLRATDVARSVLALALVISLPFVVWRAGADNEFTKTYLDAITAVVAYYFAARGTEGGMARQQGATRSTGVPGA